MENLKGWKLAALVVGVIFAFLGLMTILFPGRILMFLPFALGSILLISGAVSVFQGIKLHKVANHVANMDIFRGVMYILLAIIFLFKPAFTVEFMAIFIGILALLDGSTKVAITFALSQSNEPWGLVLADGVIEVLFGMMILFNPFGGAFTLVIIGGIYLLYFGLSMIAFSIWIKKAMSYN